MRVSEFVLRLLL